MIFQITESCRFDLDIRCHGGETNAPFQVIEQLQLLEALSTHWPQLSLNDKVCASGDHAHECVDILRPFFKATFGNIDLALIPEDGSSQARLVNTLIGSGKFTPPARRPAGGTPARPIRSRLTEWNDEPEEGKDWELSGPDTPLPLLPPPGPLPPPPPPFTCPPVHGNTIGLWLLLKDLSDHEILHKEMNLYLHHATAEFGKLFETQDFQHASCERFESLFKLMKYTAQNLTNRVHGIDVEILKHEFYAKKRRVKFPD